MTSAGNRWSYIFLIPSFYGFVSWTLWFALYALRLISWETPSAGCVLLFLAVDLCFLASLVWCAPMYRRARGVLDERLDAAHGTAGSGLELPVALSLHLVGFFGIAKYVRDMSAAFGGIKAFILVLAVSSASIRTEAHTTKSIGTQVSYVGWIAIALILYLVTRKRISKWWLLICIPQFVGNLLFIDRTRPTWILFTSAVFAIPYAKGLDFARLLRRGAIALGAFGGLFVLIAMWVGKVVSEGQYGHTILPPWAQGIYAYGTAGFAYFNHLVVVQKSFDMIPVRAFYPVYQVFHALGFTGTPPEQVLDFFQVPFPTNVGTFLEPFYRDGGMAFVGAGVLVYTLGFNLLGIYFLRMRTALGTFAWANVCFAAFIGFFTPKIGSTPFWLFCSLAILLWRGTWRALLDRAMAWNGEGPA